MKTPIHTLLATTGASPQVITETLYAIHQTNAQWPDAVFLITTSFGKTKAVQGLLHDGHLQRLCTQLQRPMPAFDVSRVLVVPGANGEEVEDARSLADHEALANFIMTEVRNRTAEGQGSLHASLAGGRKTMTFYIGYAMSLFGRAQDMLSHVLVSDGYENTPGFWFPTTNEAHRSVNNRDQTLDASMANITLAPIPFIRHRHELPPVLLQNNAAVNFSQLVQLINLGENPSSLRLKIDLPGRRIHLGSIGSDLNITFQPGTLNLAFYAMVVRCALNGETDLTRPPSGKPEASMRNMLLEELTSICGINRRATISDDIKKLKDGKDTQLTDRSLDALEGGMSNTWFDSRKNQLATMFEQQLPRSVLRWVVPSIVWDEHGQRISGEQIEKTTKGGGYGIHLQPQQISIVEMPERKGHAHLAGT